MGKIIYQNYNWFFKEKYEDLDLKLNNLEGFIKVNLPHTNKLTPLNNFDVTNNHLISIYKKYIEITDLSLIYHLVFEGAAHLATLYINGLLVNSHACGYTTFKENITSFLHLGINEIALVTNANEINQPPFGHVIDYYCFGGLYRTCYLLVSNKIYFNNYHFYYDRDNYYLDYEISSNDNYFISLKIFDENKLVISKTLPTKTKFMDKLNLEDLTLWDLDNPKLYTLVLEILDEQNNVLDEVSEQIGFRFLTFQENGFYLNDKLVKIRGLNRHQSYPYVGYAMPSSMQMDDVKILKNTLCVNAVRCSHYPQDVSFLKACDQYGLLVFEEIPGWQHIGDQKWQDIAINNVKEMILRDYHHPSIIMWGVRINESKDDDIFYLQTNEVAHLLDKTRPTAGVRCLENSSILEDVYTYNDFCCTGKDIALKNKKSVTLTNKPYLVSEFGGHMYPTKPFDNEEKRTIQALIHAKVLKEALQRKDILGTFGWCMADYNTHADFGSGDLICYHGILDIFRNNKYAAYSYMVYQKKPFLEVTCNFNIGEYNGGFIKRFLIISNCDEVKMYHNNILINSYIIKNFAVDGYIEVTDLINDLLIRCEGIDLKTSNLYKEIIKEILSYDGVVRQETINKYGQDNTTIAWNYYGKYVANWGNKATPYYFEGYKDHKLVISKYKGYQYFKEIKVTTSSDTLHTFKSYDVVKITLEAIGSLNNRVEYAFDSFAISTSENLELIGDKYQSLINGIRSFYVKSNALSGEGYVKIDMDRFKIPPIKIMIKND